MQKVYDCFAFFNELDLLEIRLNELDRVVDKFVIVEATKSFQKQVKPLHYQENIKRFHAFKDKIIHVVVDEYPNFFTRFRVPTAMDYDNHQKNQVIRGLKDARPDDIIIFSDLDEIPSADKILEYKSRPGIKVFQQLFCSYFINCIATTGDENQGELNKDGLHYWRGTVMANFSEFDNAKSFRKKRGTQSENIVQIENGGWHFTYLGGSKNILYKINSFAHSKESKYQVDQLQDTNMLDNIISQGKDLYGRDYTYEFVELDDRFPEYVLQHKDKFSHLIKSFSLANASQ